MNFKQAVLREHLRDFIDNPYEPCIAMRCSKDDDAMSSYHQFVKTSDKNAYFPETIHTIASASKVKKATAYYKKTFGQILEPVGETYCVSPYTIGFAHQGSVDKKYYEDVLKIASHRDYFHLYVRRWVDTPEGYGTMMDDIKKKGARPTTPADWDKLIVTAEKADAEQKEEDLNELKTFYVYYFTDTRWPGYKTFQQKRKDEFRNASKALTTEQLVWRCQAYYIKELAEEETTRKGNIEHYAHTSRLLHNIIR